MKAVARLSEVRIVDSERWHLKDFLGEESFQISSVSVLGTQRAGFGAVTVQIRDETGRTRAYLKYAEHPQALDRLHREDSMLREIPEGTGPAVLKAGTYGEGFAILKDVVPGRPVRLKIPPQPEIENFLDALPSRGDFSVEDHPWIRGLHQNEGFEKEGLTEALDALSNRKWPAVLQHGDYAPWNLFVASGKVRAVDWEYGTTDGFPRMDIAHYLLQITALVYRFKPADAARYITEYLVERGKDMSPPLTSREARAIVRLSAYNAYVRPELKKTSEVVRTQQWRSDIFREADTSGE